MPENGLISLMPQHEAMINPAMGYVLEKVSVFWDIEHGDVYPLSTSRKVGDHWEKLYAPSRKGLDKLAMAGGIETVDQGFTKVPDKWIWDGFWHGTYTTPTGITIPLKENYSYDVTIGGPRWCKRRDSEIDSLTIAATPALASKRYAKKEEIEEAWYNLSDEQKSTITERAENVATRYCVEGGQYGGQRAVTGARLRALRTYFEVREYTESEIRQNRFVIYRTRMDFAAMREVVGAKGAQLLAFSTVMKHAGITDQAAIEGLSRVLLEAETSGLHRVKLEEDDPFDIPIKRSTLGDISAKVVKLYPSLAPLSFRRLAVGIGKLLGREYTEETNLQEELSDGDGQCILTFYTLTSDGASNLDDLKRSMLAYMEQRVLWDGTIIQEKSNAEDPSGPDVEPPSEEGVDVEPGEDDPAGPEA